MTTNEDYKRHMNLTEMQVEIMTVLKEIYQLSKVDGVVTTELLNELVSRFGKRKREWQGSLKGLGMKGYITYGNGYYSSDGGVQWLERAVDYFDNFLTK